MTTRKYDAFISEAVSILEGTVSRIENPEENLETIYQIGWIISTCQESTIESQKCFAMVDILNEMCNSPDIESRAPLGTAAIKNFLSDHKKRLSSTLMLTLFSAAKQVAGRYNQ